MNRTVVALAQQAHAGWPRTELEASLGAAAAELYHCFLHDIYALVHQLPRTQVEVCAAEAGVGALTSVVAYGPAMVISADAPHVPIWRLRDAFTLLEDGADLVIGPCERGSWYLVALRAPQPDLARFLPASGAPIRPLVRRARDLGLKVAGLPAWYRLATPTDLDRLGDDLRALPTPTATHTFALLSGTDLRTHAVGG